MTYAVYADLSRRLTEQERAALFETLEACVPGSGCVGLQKGPNDEVYFVLEALSEEAAGTQAERCMSQMLQNAALEVECAVTLKRIDRD